MREMGKLAGLALALGCSGTAFAGPIYKCQGGDKTYFQNQPCADAEQRSGGRMDNKPAIHIGKHNSAGGAVEARIPPLGGSSADKPRRVILIAAPAGLVDACVDEFRPLLRNPDELYVVSGELQAVKNKARPDIPEWTEVVVDGRAAEGNGGYAPKLFHCVLADDGSIDPQRTASYKALMRMNIYTD